MVLVSTLPFFPDLLGWPIETVALINSAQAQATLANVIQATLIQLGLTLCAMLWVHLFQDAISGARFYDYLRTLPIPRRFLDRIDFAVLILANFPLWCMVAMSLIIAPYKLMHLDVISLFLARILLVTFLLVYAQTQFLRRRKFWMLRSTFLVGLMNLFGFLPNYLHMAGILAILFIFSANFLLSRFATEKLGRCWLVLLQ